MLKMFLREVSCGMTWRGKWRGNLKAWLLVLNLAKWAYKPSLGFSFLMSKVMCPSSHKILWWLSVVPQVLVVKDGGTVKTSWKLCRGGLALWTRTQSVTFFICDTVSVGEDSDYKFKQWRKHKVILVIQECNEIECQLYKVKRSQRRRQWQPAPVFLPGKSHGQRSLVGFSPGGREQSNMTEWLHFYFSLSCIGEGNGNSLQCSCLENLRDGGAWWAAIYGVAQSWTRLKWLSSKRCQRKLMVK